MTTRLASIGLLVIGLIGATPVSACTQSTLQLYGPTPHGEVLSQSSGLPFWFPDAALTASTQTLWGQYLYPITLARIIVVWAPTSLSQQMKIVMFQSTNAIQDVLVLTANRVGPTGQGAVITESLNELLVQPARWQIGYQINTPVLIYSVRVELVKC